jgi:hypothetical protein
MVLSVFRRWWFPNAWVPHAWRRKTRQDFVLREWDVLLHGLRQHASARLADAGDALRAGELSTAQERVRNDYLWALEAYDAAGKLFDEAVDLPDLAAVVVLAERSVERLEMVLARQSGKRAAPPIRRCFYNPLHPVAVIPGPRRRRRGRGGPRQAAADRHPACADCRRAILAGGRPDILPALVPVRTSRRRTAKVLVPYYAVPQQWSLWSTTACGAWDDDCPALVLRGEHRRRAAARKPG